MIDFDEFSAVVNGHQKNPETEEKTENAEKQEMLQLFRIFDKDGDG